MPMNVAIIGAGSKEFTRKLVGDLLSVPELRDTCFHLTDIDEKNLELMDLIVKNDIKNNNLPAKVFSSKNRKEVLEGADYVINSVRVGGIEAYETDINIPLKYGVDQCVGDTICAGGIMYGQRNIPVILDICKDIKEVSSKDVLFLNYSNPNAMNTWAANKYGEVNTVGLCHGVYGGHKQITNVIELLINGDKKEEDAGFTPVTMEDVDIVCAGINHQTWYTKVQYKGEDWTGRLLEGFLKHPDYRETEKIRIDMIKRFGYYSTESNGHLSEYLPWYRKRPNEIKEWIHLGESWIHGETGGYLRYTKESREKFLSDNISSQEKNVISKENRSHEHASYIIEALETGRVYRGHFNVQNNHCISNLPNDCIVEVPGYVDKNGINIPRLGDLPIGCAAVCNVSVNVQRLAVEAAVHGDVNFLKQAMMMDPLVGAVCNPPEIWQMTNEMLIAQKAWLPQYFSEIKEIEKSYTWNNNLGRFSTEGAARLNESEHSKSKMKESLELE